MTIGILEMTVYVLYREGIIHTLLSRHILITK